LTLIDPVARLRPGELVGERMHASSRQDLNATGGGVSAATDKIYYILDTASMASASVELVLLLQ
jgi:hypothetical protein